MIRALKKLFQNPAGDAQHSADEIRHLVAAALLIEVARADSAQDAAEEAAMAGLLRNTLHLDEKDLETLLRKADAAVDSATSLYEFTRLVNEHYSYEDKRALLRCMWQVAYADASLDKYEEHLIRRVADLIYLNHRDFIRTKHAARLSEPG